MNKIEALEKIEELKKRFAEMSREYTNEREEIRKELDRIIKVWEGVK